MSVVEGYVYHTYGPDRYVRDAVASVLTLRRYDTKRPVALYCPPSHLQTLQEHGLDSYFQFIDDLPEENQSIIGFKHKLHKFSPFDRCLFVDSDMIWCRPLDPLWTQLSAFLLQPLAWNALISSLAAPKASALHWIMYWIEGGVR